LPFVVTDIKEPKGLNDFLPLMKPMDITAIICAYSEERWDDLLKSIGSIRSQSLPVSEIILVIDHNPLLFERAKRELENIHVVENVNKRGASGARNTAIGVAKGEILAFIDDDAVYAPDCLQLLVGRLSDEKVMGVGGYLIPNWESSRPAWFPEEFYWVVGCAFRGMQTDPRYIRNLIGACMCLRREIFTTVGNFHSGLGPGSQGFYCEETELCIRAKKQWPERFFVYEPQALAYHHVPTKRTNFSYFRSRCYVEGISKSVVVQFAGGSSGLASERLYTMKYLPSGIWRGITEIFQGDLSGFIRSGAIIIGLGYTIAGYIKGNLSRFLRPKRYPLNDGMINEKVNR